MYITVPNHQLLCNEQKLFTFIANIIRCEIEPNAIDNIISVRFVLQFDSIRLASVVSSCAIDFAIAWYSSLTVISHQLSDIVVCQSFQYEMLLHYCHHYRLFVGWPIINANAVWAVAVAIVVAFRARWLRGLFGFHFASAFVLHSPYSIIHNYILCSTFLAACNTFWVIH